MMRTRGPIPLLGVNSDSSIALFLQGYQEGRAKLDSYPEKHPLCVRRALIELLGKDPIHIYSQEELRRHAEQLRAMYMDVTNPRRMGYISALLDDPGLVLKVLVVGGGRAESRQMVQTMLQ